MYIKIITNVKKTVSLQPNVRYLAIEMHKPHNSYFFPKRCTHVDTIVFLLPFASNNANVFVTRISRSISGLMAKSLPIRDNVKRNCYIDTRENESSLLVVWTVART